MSEFQVRRDDFTQLRCVDTPSAGALPALGDGEIRVAVDRFAFTANNITYAAAGDILGYWQFFPPHGADTKAWGVIPVWGFADVIASNVAAVPVGDRLYGYFPPAAHLDMTPKGVTEERLIDGAAHRADLPPAYNHYSRVHAEPASDGASEDERALLAPLYITSYCLWDVLRDNDWYGAQQIVIVSASSKTSIGLAYALADDDSAPATVAITSARNAELVDRIGVYDQRVTYDTLDALAADVPSVIVDMSGNADLLARLIAHFGDNLSHCVRVGLTHWADTRAQSDGLGSRSEFFFAPSHIGKRMQDWGPAEFARRSTAFIDKAARASRDWLTLAHIDGLEAFGEIYPEVCNGRIAADRGLIVTL